MDDALFPFRDSRAARLTAGAVLALLVFAAGAAVPAGESASDPNVQRAAPIESAALAPKAATLGPNLVPNPSVETAAADGSQRPEGWRPGGYGSNSASFAYPVAGSGGSGTRAVKVAISQYASGDAKWYFADVPAIGGASYQYSNVSLASVPSVVVARFVLAGGGERYQDLLFVPASDTFRTNAVRFTAAPDATALAVFHVIHQVGQLTTDEHALQEVRDAPLAQNLLRNGSFEDAVASGTAPVAWLQRGAGRHERTFTYPVPGASGSGAQVAIRQWQSGASGWASAPLALAPGLYRFRDRFLADRSSVVTARFVGEDGRRTGRRLGGRAARAAWTEASLLLAVPVTAATTSVQHAITGDGTLAIDEASLVEQSVFDTGAVTFRFDDGHGSHHAIAAPRLEQAGFAGTFYVISQRTADSGYPGYLSIAQVRDLSARGHEIGGHTRTHVRLTPLSPRQRQEEVAGGRAEVRAWGVGPVLSFAYPFGDYDAATIQAVLDAGFTSAAATITGGVTAASDPFQLQYREVTSATRLADVQAWLADAAAQRHWLILTFHRIENSSEYYSVPPALLDSIVDAVKASGLPVVTATQGRASLRE